MRALVVSVVCAVCVGAGVLLVLATGGTSPPEQSRQRETTFLLEKQLAVLREHVAQQQQEVRALKAELEDLRQSLAALREPGPEPPEEEPKAADSHRQQKGTPQGSDQGEELAEADLLPPPPLRPYAGELQEYVFGLIEKERALRAEERRRKAEQFRRQTEEFRQGPYGRLNLRVNSMAHVLSLDLDQKERYYEISKAYLDASTELRKSVNWKNAEERKRYKEEYDRLQKAFSEEVQSILSPQQREVYRKLAPWYRTIHNLGRILDPSEQAAYKNGSVYVQSDLGHTVIFRAEEKR